MPTTRDKFFHSTNFTLHYREARRACVILKPQPALTLFCLFNGKLNWKFETGADNELKDKRSELEFPRVKLQTARNEVEKVSGILTKHSALLVNADESLTARAESFELLQISLAASFVVECAVRAAFARDDALIRFRHKIVKADEKLFRLARDLADEINSAQKGHEIMLASCVEQLTVHLLRQHSQVRRDSAFELSRVGLVDRRIRRAVELMHNALERDLSLEEIAAAAYLSPFHFARLFKKATGATPRAYLAALRLSRAQKLLAQTDLSVTEISARVGYQSASHFTKAFRQTIGLTPSEFRRALVRN